MDMIDKGLRSELLYLHSYRDGSGAVDDFQDFLDGVAFGGFYEFVG
jgi:hypothetical protein